MMRRVEPNPKFQKIKYQDTKIVIEVAPAPVEFRVLFGALSLPCLLIGLKGCFDFAKLILGLGNGSENVFIGVVITTLCLVVFAVGLWIALDSGKSLILNPETKTADLTRRSIFRSIEKQFSFRGVGRCVMSQDADLSTV